jgi:hypothetical protein
VARDLAAGAKDAIKLAYTSEVLLAGGVFLRDLAISVELRS